MTTPTPMSDARLAEIEAWAYAETVPEARRAKVELVAEVRRGREEVAQLRAPEYAVQVAHDLARASTMTVHEAQQALGVVQDAIDARARVADLEAERNEARELVDALEAENDQLKLAREHPHSAVLASRVLRAEEERDAAQRFVEDAQRDARELTQQRDRARSIAMALEAELAQLQATARTVLDDRDRLQDRGLAALAIRDAHQWVGGRRKVETECVCQGCEMGRALDGETPRRWQ